MCGRTGAGRRGAWKKRCVEEHAWKNRCVEEQMRGRTDARKNRCAEDQGRGRSGARKNFFLFRLLPLSLRHFRRMSPSVLIRTRAVSDVEVAPSGRTGAWKIGARKNRCVEEYMRGRTDEDVEEYMRGRTDV